MEPMVIKVNELVSCNKGVTPDEGKVVYDKLIAAFNNEQPVILDFAGIEMMTTAFLNVAIGNLYKTYTSEQLRELLKLVNVSETTAFRIKKVTDRAKDFYDNPEEFNQGVKEVLDENK